jgi:uncharacterized protein (DUF362 family)
MNNVVTQNVTENLKQSLNDLLDQLGSLSKIISKDSRVLVKPNFNTADPYPASTDPLFLKTFVELVLENDPKEIYIGDACTFSQNTQRVMDDLNVFELEKIDQRIKIINFDKHKRVKKKVPKGKYLRSVYLPQILDEIDKLIYLPCCKTHFAAQYTGSLKLSVGLMNKRQKMSFHINHLCEKIAELNTIIQPDLIVMDARKCFISEGPAHGPVREPNLLLASSDHIAIDMEAVKIIQSFEGNSLEGIKPEEISQIKAALQLI